MAAHPLPQTPSVYIANAATATDISVVPGQPIEWENSTPNDINIVITAVGVYPLTANTFTVKGTNGPISTKLNGVLSACPINTYSFSRNGVMGSGRIIVKSSK
jgi:hypothetical protein